MPTFHADQVVPQNTPPPSPESQSGGDWWAQNAPKSVAQVTNPITKTSAPPVPRPPLPWELRTDAQKHQAEVERKQKLAAGATPDIKPLTPYQGFQAATNIPVVGGLVQTGEGIAEALRATSGPEAAKGATKAIGGALEAALPLAGESILEKPAEVAISGIAGWATQEATQAGLKKLGIKPEYSDLAGSISGLLSGYAAGKIRLSPEQTTLVESLQGKEVPDQVAKLQKLATDESTTQAERDAASAFLKKKFGIDHPAFKPAEQKPAPTPEPTQQPLPLKPESAPAPETPAPEASTPSLNQDVQETPEGPAELTPEHTGTFEPEEDVYDLEKKGLIEPKKPEAAAHPVGTFLKGTDGSYVKVLGGDNKELNVVGINPSTGNPWISPVKFGITAKEMSEWKPVTLPEPKTPAKPAAASAPASEPLKPLDMDQVAAASVGDDWLENWSKPGNVVKSGYWGDYDKVIEYKPKDTGGWSVKVIKSDKDGNPVAGEKERWHSTPPTYKDALVKYDPSILVKKTAPPPAPKASQTPVAVSGAPTKEPPTLKGYKKKLTIPDKYSDNEEHKVAIFGSSDKYDLGNYTIPSKIEVMNLLAPAVEHLKIPDPLKGLFFEGGMGSLTDHQKVIAGLVNAWAGTSADSDKNSVAIQIAAQKEFGLAVDWDFKKVNKAGDDVLNDAYDIYGKSAEFLRAFLRAQYTQTQKFFKDKNIKSLTLYRGMRYQDTDSMGSMKAEYGQVETHRSTTVQLQPLSSFSMDGLVAAGFSGSVTGALMASVVPAGRIFATPKTGIGCLTEYEVVLLSGDSHQNAAAAVSWNNTPKSINYLSAGDRLDMLKVFMQEVESKSKKVAKNNAGKSLAKSDKK